MNEEYIVKIIDVDNKGNGIARIDNIVVFIKGTLLNEQVKIKIIDKKKKYLVGELVEIIKKSPLRTPSLCPYYNSCGGCNFMHTNLDNELEIKYNLIKKLFPNTKLKLLDIDYEYNYRNKVILHVKDGILGLYKEKTNEIINIDKCLLLDNNINLVIEKLNKYDLSNVSQITIKHTYFTNCLMIIIKGYLKVKDIKDLLKLDNLKSLYFDDKLIYGDSYIIESINGIKYTINKDAFFQVNTRGMILLYEQIKKYVKDSNSLLDLYCGTGTIGIYLKDKFKNITGVEINEDPIKNANLNKKLNNINNIEFICGDSSIINKKFDCLIIDPPRSGLSKKVIDNINNNDYKQIIYVSCNPLTLKRDIDLLNDKYILKEISILDMFVKTEHVETIVLLECR